MNEGECECPRVDLPLTLGRFPLDFVVPNPVMILVATRRVYYRNEVKVQYE